jgi:hypothetical protein
MRITAIPSVIGFITHNANRAPAQATVAATRKPLSADRAMRLASAAIIVVMLDALCILLVSPIATQLALLAGISFLHTVYIGLGTMLASIPFILAATILLLRRSAKNGGTIAKWISARV